MPSFSKIRLMKHRSRLPSANAVEEKTVFERVAVRSRPAKSKLKKKKCALRWKENDDPGTPTSSSISSSGNCTKSPRLRTWKEAAKGSSDEDANRKMNDENRRRDNSNVISMEGARPSQRRKDAIVSAGKERMNRSASEDAGRKRVTETARRRCSLNTGRNGSTTSDMEGTDLCQCSTQFGGTTTGTTATSTINSQEGDTDHEEASESSSDSQRDNVFTGNKTNASVFITAPVNTHDRPTKRTENAKVKRRKSERNESSTLTGYHANSRQKSVLQRAIERAKRSSKRSNTSLNRDKSGGVGVRIGNEDVTRERRQSGWKGRRNSMVELKKQRVASMGRKEEGIRERRKKSVRSKKDVEREPSARASVARESEHPQSKLVTASTHTAQGGVNILREQGISAIKLRESLESVRHVVRDGTTVNTQETKIEKRSPRRLPGSARGNIPQGEPAEAEDHGNISLDSAGCNTPPVPHNTSEFTVSVSEGVADSDTDEGSFVQEAGGPLSHPCATESSEPRADLKSQSMLSKSIWGASDTSQGEKSDDYETLVSSTVANKTLDLIRRHDLFHGVATNGESVILGHFFTGECEYSDQVQKVLFDVLERTITRVKDVDHGEDVTTFIKNKEKAAFSMCAVMKLKKDYAPVCWKSRGSGAQKQKKYRKSAKSDDGTNKKESSIVSNERSADDTLNVNRRVDRTQRKNENTNAFQEEFSFLPPNV